MIVAQFNFNDYFENPIVKFCQQNIHEKLPDADFHVYTLEDVLPIIKHLPHAKKALDDKRWSFIGDQLRLYLALQTDDFFYADADVYFSDINKILSNKNCTDAYFVEDNLEINNGTFFYSDKNCKFNNYYFNLYQNNSDILCSLNNMNVFHTYPFELDKLNMVSGDMNLLLNNNYHFLLSTFKSYYMLGNDSYTEVYYTFNKNDKLEDSFHRPNPTWVLSGKRDYVGAGKQWIFNIDYPYIPQETLLELFKEQLQYTVGHTIKFTEI